MLVAGLVWCVCPAQARADNVVLTDLTADAALADEAGAASLLIQSMVRAGSRPVIHRRALSTALEAVAPATERRSLSIERSKAAQLMAKLEADRLVGGTLARDGRRLMMSVYVLGPTGSTITAINEVGSPAAVADLTRALSRRLAPHLDATFADVPGALTPSWLHPFVAAAAGLASGDATRAARALELAPARAASGTPGAKEVADALWQNARLARDLRVNAALVAGEADAAARIAAEWVADKPNDPAARAARSRALTATRDFFAAERELGKIRGGRADPEVAIARAELAIDRRDARPKVDEALAPLVGQPPEAWRKALGFLTGAAPLAFGSEIEQAAVAAAEHFATTEPALASQIALRALAGDIAPDRAAPLVRPGDLAPDQVAWLKEKIAPLAAQGGPGVAKLAAALNDEQEATQEVLTDRARKHLGEQTMTTPAQLVDRLLPVLRRFEQLAGKAVGTIALVPLQGSGQLALWPFTVKPEALRTGLVFALSGPPYNLTIADLPEGFRPLDSVQESSIEPLAAVASATGAQALLMYRVRPTGRDARVELRLFDASATAAFETSAVIPGFPSGLVGPNPIALAIGGALLLLGLGWSSGLTQGRVVVNIRRDPHGHDEALSLLLSQSATPPGIPDPASYARTTRRAGPAKERHRASLVGEETVFRRITPGQWFVHLYGTQMTKAGLVVLKDDLMRTVRVHRGRASTVTFTVDTIAVAKSKRGQLQSDAAPRALIPSPVSAAAAIELEIEPSPPARAPAAAVLDLPTTPSMLSVPVAPVRNAPSDIFLNMGDLGLGQAGTNAAAKPAPRVSPRPAHADKDVGGAPSSDSLVGLRRYQQVDELGRGGMGVVYRARDLVLEREVALKILSRALRDHPAAAKRFLLEAKALASLNHPNIVTIFDQGQDRDDIFLVMELVEGGTLEDKIKDGARVPWASAISYMEQVCAAMSYAHSRRIVHRDIKPANIFIAPGGQVKMGDFGLARALQAAQISKTMIQGTPLYMSPEQIRGVEIDFRTDLYSIGCTLFELVTGQAPFVDGDVLYHHVHSPPPRPSDLVPDLPPQLDALLASCLTKDKQARIESADAIAKALQEVRAAWNPTLRVPAPA